MPQYRQGQYYQNQSFRTHNSRWATRRSDPAPQSGKARLPQWQQNHWYGPQGNKSKPKPKPKPNNNYRGKKGSNT